MIEPPSPPSPPTLPPMRRSLDTAAVVAAVNRRLDRASLDSLVTHIAAAVDAAPELEERIESLTQRIAALEQAREADQRSYLRAPAHRRARAIAAALVLLTGAFAIFVAQANLSSPLALAALAALAGAAGSLTVLVVALAGRPEGE